MSSVDAVYPRLVEEHKENMGRNSQNDVHYNLDKTPESFSTTEVLNTKVTSIKPAISTHSLLYLHDDSYLRVQASNLNSLMVDGEGLHIEEPVTLTFTHIKLGQKDSEWTVLLASCIPPCKGFDHYLIVEALSPEIVPSLQDYSKWIWCTLYWYFQLPKPSPAAGVKPGAVKEEWKVLIRGSQIYKPLLNEVERGGLIFSTCTSAQRAESEAYIVFSKTFWQIPPDTFYHPTGFSGSSYALHPHPLQYSLPSTNGRHPLRPRPPCPGETFYKRYIPSLNSFLTLRTANLDTDVPLLHKWMNNPRVNAFWGEAGPDSHQQEFLKKGLEASHCFPVIGSWRDLSATDSANGKEGLESSMSGTEEEIPFGYFEIYWVKEDRLAGYTETGDWDRGVHVLVGEEKFRGYHRVKVWLSSLVHCMSLSVYSFDVKLTNQICSFRIRVL